MHCGKMYRRHFFHCGLWSAVTDATIQCVKEAIFKPQQQ